MSKVYVLINEKDKSVFPRTFYKHDEVVFRKANAEGWGVFCAVNDFEATADQMAAAGKKTKRNIGFLEKINSVFADLDIAKAGDGKTREEREKLKEDLLFALYEIAPPSVVIDTSNGVQPLWTLKGSSTDKTYQTRYVNLINGIIAWSVAHGAKGDKVKDVTRVLRVPGYFHMKQEPYMVTAKYVENFIYTLEELENIFKNYIVPEEKEEYKPKPFQLDEISTAIEMLDIREVAKLAFAEIGRTCDFDNTGRAIIDERLTGTFKGHTGNFMASTSHEPYKGNVVTLVARIKTISNKEAREWLIDKFNIRKKIIENKNLPKPKKPLGKCYSWGTQGLTDSIAPIKRTTYSIIGGGYGVGKTPFCLNIAIKNALAGHRVLYLSLEMDTEEIFDFLGRKAAGITIPEENNNSIPDYKKDIYNQKKSELESLSNFALKGVRKGIDVDWMTLCELMKGEWDLIIVDNFNLIQKDKNVNQFEHEANLSKSFLAYTEDNQTPIIVVHHYSKGGAKEVVKTGYSLSGNSKIMNDAQRLLLLDRKKFAADDEPTEEERAEMRVIVDKGRAYDCGFTKTVYFQKGEFVDKFGVSKPQVYWQDKI
jgi:hypothetical protein